MEFRRRNSVIRAGGSLEASLKSEPQRSREMLAELVFSAFFAGVLSGLSG